MKLVKIVKYVLINFTIVIMISATVIIGGFISEIPSCGENSESVSYAKSLSQERLSQLYKDVRSYASLGREFYRVEFNSELSPAELSDINYHDLLLDGVSSRIMLEGCFDNYVILKFDGVYNDNPPAIILSWGEGPDSGKAKLWPQ